MIHRTYTRNSAIAVVLTTMAMMACTGIIGVTEVPEGMNSAAPYVPQPCQPGTKQCYGTIPKTCDANGEWEGETACPYACNSGACTGVCVPDSKQCSGTTPQTCDDNGEWKSETVCANACLNGACTGVCTATSKQCSGNGVQTCDENGAWGTAVACAPSTPVCSGATCGSPPSCSGLTNNCGGSAGTDNCCASIVVPGGTFNRSNDGSYPATISSFRLDTYEVTVGRFRKFLASYSQSMTPSGAGKNPNNPTDPGWNPEWNASLPASAAALQAALKCSGTYLVWTDTPGANENRPVNCVSWYEAQAFCIWDGGRLPTETEWNYAAAGGGGPQGQRLFPWGSTAGANFASYWTNGTCFGDGVDGCSVADFLPVGTKTDGKNPWGHADLGGNVWEWVQDLFTPQYSSTTCIDCATLTANGVTNRLVRGGSFIDFESTMKTTSRGAEQPPTVHNWSVGIRCARSQ